MKMVKKAANLYLFALFLLIVPIWSVEALAQSSYFSSQGCSGCHAPPVIATCNGCHGHGTHPNSAKSAVNVAGTTNKGFYAPGETVTVTMTGGYRTGWFRAILYDQNMIELARSTGNDSGMGSSATYPATLSSPAPMTPGTYSWKVAWYGYNFEAGTGAFGPDWTPDPNNPNHGAEIVSITTPFVVATATPPLPTISSILPNSLFQGVANQIITITGSNLAGATVSFSNLGIAAGLATGTSTSLVLPVNVAATAATGNGTVTVTTANGSASAFFSVTAAAIPAPAISSIAPSSLVQGAVNQIVTITGANLSGATVSFSNSGVIGGPVSGSSTAISLPVIVAANATTGSGTVTVTTAGGSASGAFNITPRSSTPILIISALSDGSYTNNPTLNISGSVSAATGIQSVVINNQYVTVMPNGFFSTALLLIPGANTITVVATDNSGIQKSDIRIINFDPIGPILTIDIPPDNSLTTSSFITVSGNVNETSTVVVTANSGSPQFSSMTGNIFSVTVNLQSGVNTINIVAYDLAGNTTNAKRTVIYDTTKLTLAVTNPSQDMTTALSTQVIMGSVTNSSKEITVTITMDGQTYTQLVTNGIFKQLLTFTTAKLYVITVNARDAAGNNSTVTRNVIYSPAVTTSHPFGWTNPRSSHPSYVNDNGVAGCTGCHSIASSSSGTMSCYRCHGQVWTTPAGGGTTSHPFGWTNPENSHQNYVESNGVAGCLGCHSIASSSSGTMSCYRCHGQKWETPAGNETTTSHPFGWTNPENSHPNYVESNGVSGCLGCHSIDSSSSGTMSCYRCHGKEWDTPASGGTTTSHPFGWTNPQSSHPNYVQSNGVAGCLSCHSIDPSSSGTMSCYRCHGQVWAVPAGGGTTTSHPFGWTNPQSSHPNYVQSNGVSGCLSCHSIDPSSSGTMSCYRCHGQVWAVPAGGGTTTSHPFGWSNPRSSHQNYVESNGVSGCTACHSTASGSKGQTMSCYNCHGKKW